MNRRNILTLLGLAPVTTAAISSDDVTLQTYDGRDPGYRMSQVDPERMAIALERLAAEIRSDDVNVSRFHIGSEIVGDEFLKQTLTIDVEILHNAKHVKSS